MNGNLSTLRGDAHPEIIPQYETAACTLAERDFYTPREELDDIFFVPSYIGHYICKKEYEIQRDDLNVDGLILVTTAGEGRLIRGDGDIRLTPGTVYIQNCYEHHHYKAVSNGWEFRYVHFCGGLSKNYCDMIAKRSPVTRPSPNAFDSVLRLMADIKNGVEDAAVSHARLSGYIYEMLVIILDSFRKTPERGDPKADAIMDAINYIRDHIAEELDTPMLARRAFMSRTYFSALFTRVCGVPPHEYVITLRINRAKKLLADTSLPVWRVAELSGFSDASALARMFRMRCGVNPTAYRSGEYTPARI